MKVRSIVLSLPLILVACAAPVAERSASSHEKVQASGASQDWSLLGEGQCLASLQAFYRAKFGATVGLAPDYPIGDCASDGACLIWLDGVPNDAEWERVAFGEGTPQPYDLLVYPPSGTNPWGHVASVDHVDGDGTVWVMDANFNGDEMPSTTPHTVARAPYGFYHLRALGPTSEGAPQPQTQPDLPAKSDLTCGELAAEHGFAERAACEWDAESMGACGGQGTRTRDCLHCCAL